MSGERTTADLKVGTTYVSEGRPEGRHYVRLEADLKVGTTLGRGRPKGRHYVLGDDGRPEGRHYVLVNEGRPKGRHYGTGLHARAGLGM